MEMDLNSLLLLFFMNEFVTKLMFNSTSKIVRSVKLVLQRKIKTVHFDNKSIHINVMMPENKIYQEKIIFT